MTAERLEERCTPAAPPVYDAATQTLTIVGADNDQIVVAGNFVQPTGYLTVEVNSGQIFTSVTNAQPVRNLIVRFSGVDHGSIELTSSVELGGNLSVFGAQYVQDFKSRARIGGNLNYTSPPGTTYDDLTLYGNTEIGGNLNLRLGGGSDNVFLRGGSIGGNLLVTGRSGDVELAKFADLSIGGSAAFRFQEATNTITGQGPYRVSVGKSLTFSGSDWVNKFDFKTAGTELEVGRDATFQVKRGVPGGHGLFQFDTTRVHGNLNILGSKRSDFVEFQNGLNVGGNLAARLFGGPVMFGENELHLNAPPTGVNVIGGNLVYAGGAGQDVVRLDATRVGKNANIALGDSHNNLQALVIGHNDADGLRVFGSLLVTAGASNDKVQLHRLYVGSTLSLKTGGGHDLVAIDDVDVAGVTSIDLGAGNDAVIVETDVSDAAGGLNTYSTFGGTLTVRAGAGDDVVDLSMDGNSTTVILFGSKVALHGGDGTDVFDADATFNQFMVTGNFEDFETDLGAPLP